MVTLKRERGAGSHHLHHLFSPGGTAQCQVGPSWPVIFPTGESERVGVSAQLLHLCRMLPKRTTSVLPHPDYWGMPHSWVNQKCVDPTNPFMDSIRKPVSCRGCLTCGSLQLTHGHTEYSVHFIHIHPQTKKQGMIETGKFHRYCWRKTTAINGNYLWVVMMLDWGDQDLKATALDKFEELKKTVFIELKESMMTMTQQISDRLKNK